MDLLFAFLSGGTAATWAWSFVVLMTNHKNAQTKDK